MDQKVFWNIMLYLFLLYLNIILSFSIIYFYLDFSQLGPIVDHYASDEHQDQWFDRLTRSIYFSAITLMSVGYGDLTPFGISKAIAVLQAMLGYILPPAIVARYILFPSTSLEKTMVSSTLKEHDGT